MSSAPVSYGSREWANNQLKYGITCCRGGFKSPFVQRVQIIRDIIRELALNGWEWQVKILQIYLNRLIAEKGISADQGEGRFAPEGGGS